MKNLVLNENFFNELFNDELNEDCYNKYDLISNLLVNNESIDINSLELFTNGYVSKLIRQRFENIKSVDEVKFEMNKLELFANNLPLEISKELFTSEDVLEALLILKPRAFNYIFKETDSKLLSIILDSYLKKYREEKNNTKQIKQAYNDILEQGIMLKRVEQDDLDDIKEEMKKYSTIINNQNMKEEKCLSFIMTLNDLLLEKMDKSTGSRTCEKYNK